jgi:hypothetical protein
LDVEQACYTWEDVLAYCGVTHCQVSITSLLDQFSKNGGQWLGSVVREFG